jgi:glycosyltransferase involved in cell wall biosynthesis
MGYAQGALSKALARLGAEVHLVTLNFAPYHQLPNFDSVYGGFLNKEIAPKLTEEIDGYQVHYLQNQKILGYPRMKGIYNELRKIKPDIVQTFTPIAWISLEPALYKPFLRYKLFTGNHTTRSVFPLAQHKTSFWNKKRIKVFLNRTLHGWFISLFTEKCYAATVDCADVAIDFFGVPRNKIAISPIGVDTDVFFPMQSQDDRSSRLLEREKYGFKPTDIVCVYSGRFTEDKNPLVLAKAISGLRAQGYPFSGFFIGNGEQAERIRQEGGIIHPFIPFTELRQLYWLADIGVWPTQESTSMIDVAACGFPIVVNDTLEAKERINGNGVTYHLNDVEDLMKVLLSLQDPAIRSKLGTVGATKMKNDFSWTSIAGRRLQDYKKALNQE